MESDIADQLWIAIIGALDHAPYVYHSKHKRMRASQIFAGRPFAK